MAGTTEFDPAPTSDAATGRGRWQSGTDTSGRVYYVLLGGSEPTPYSEIAELRPTNIANRASSWITDPSVDDFFDAGSRIMDELRQYVRNVVADIRTYYGNLVDGYLDGSDIDDLIVSITTRIAGLYRQLRAL